MGTTRTERADPGNREAAHPGGSGPSAGRFGTMSDDAANSEYDKASDEELTAYGLNDLGQLQPDETLDDRGVDDPLDEGYSPADRPAKGTFDTAEEVFEGESLDERLSEEEPDPNLAVDDPLANPDVTNVGGDDPDAIPAEDDFLSDGEVGDERAGRLVAEDEGSHEDAESELVGEDAGVDGAADSAEEAAIHVVDEDSDEA